MINLLYFVLLCGFTCSQDAVLYCEGCLLTLAVQQRRVQHAHITELTDIKKPKERTKKKTYTEIYNTNQPAKRSTTTIAMLAMMMSTKSQRSIAEHQKEWKNATAISVYKHFFFFFFHYFYCVVCSHRQSRVVFVCAHQINKSTISLIFFFYFVE